MRYAFDHRFIEWMKFILDDININHDAGFEVNNESLDGYLKLNTIEHPRPKVVMLKIFWREK